MPGTDHPDPAAWLQSAENRERLRQAAAGMLQNPRLDPLSVPFAEHWAGMKPLAVPLSEGTPAPARAFAPTGEAHADRVS